jgi:hypothetical protein
MSGFVLDVARSAWPFAVTIVVIAVFSTALIQTVKDLLPVRRWFQQSFVRKWLSARAKESTRRRHTNLNVTDAEKDLIHLATGGDVAAFYDLETEQLCGQMNSAAQIVLAYAARHPNLLPCLAPEAAPADIENVMSVPESGAAETSQLTAEQSKAVTALLDARNRVAHQVQRGIDALQISMSFRWKLILQIAAYILCFAIPFAGVFWINPEGQHRIFDAMIIGILAGFFSPVVRDLMAVVNRLRKA